MREWAKFEDLIRRDDVAWACELFDGEGCISVDKRYSYPTLIMSMTDKDLVERFHAVVGFGNITTRHQKDRGYQKQYSWRASGYKNIKALYEMFKPWLGERRTKKFKEAFEAYENAPHRRRVSET